MTSYTKIFTLFILALCVASAPAKAADSFTPEQKAEIETILKEYLLENGKVVIDAVDAFRIKEQEESEAKAETTIQDNIGALTSADAPSIGNPDGDITVVEFFDYNCGYCKRAVPDIQALVADDENVRVVFHEMPILGPSSMTAAKWAEAAHKQGKYFEYHVALMEHRGEKSDDELAKLADGLGLDVEQMKKDVNSDAIKTKIEHDLEMARTIGINGTPAFIVDGKLYPGYLGKDGLKSAIETAREKSDNKDG